MVTRAAFTLIELIFAIVIIAIVFLALPTISSSNNDSVESSMLQEAIFPLSARLSQILSYQWDHNSENNNTIGEYAKVVDGIDATGTPYARLPGSIYRQGHIQQVGTEFHRSFHANVPNIARNVSGLGIDGANDIDDFDTGNTAVALYSRSGDIEGYKKNYLVTVGVTYCNDALAGFTFTATPSAVTTNMKMVTISLDVPLADGTTDTGAVVLRSYAANIGEVPPFSRRY